MGFTIKELMDSILESEMDNERKSQLLENIYVRGRITEGLYLRRTDGSEELECWFRNTDENGQTEHGPTYLGPEELVEEYDRVTKTKMR